LPTPPAFSSEAGVLPAPFLDGEESYDRKKYLDLLLRAAAEVLVSFGLNLKDLEVAVGYGTKPNNCRKWPALP
jgi:hypothetical protein